MQIYTFFQTCNFFFNRSDAGGSHALRRWSPCGSPTRRTHLRTVDTASPSPLPTVGGKAATADQVPYIFASAGRRAAERKHSEPSSAFRERSERLCRNLFRCNVRLCSTQEHQKRGCGGKNSIVFTPSFSSPLYRLRLHSVLSSSPRRGFFQRTHVFSVGLHPIPYFFFCPSSDRPLFSIPLPLPPASDGCRPIQRRGKSPLDTPEPYFFGALFAYFT